jgi:hypothetical protein
MCTVSIISLGDSGGYRLVTNRDEHRERAPALPPRWHEAMAAGGVRAIWPVDGAAGGTWVGASERGLTLALLNLNLRTGENPPDAAAFGVLSRGLIIPRLIGASDPEEVAGLFAATPLGEFLPFRLIAVGRSSTTGRVAIVECRWDGVSPAVVRHDGSPVCFVSSGLGDGLVEPRLVLFEAMVAGAGATAEAQDAFHVHRWADRPAISVMMSRAEARTVSVCRVEARPKPRGAWDVKMEYVPVAEAAVRSVAGRAAVSVAGTPPGCLRLP